MCMNTSPLRMNSVKNVVLNVVVVICVQVVRVFLHNNIEFVNVNDKALKLFVRSENPPPARER